jgi:adenosylcobinamide-phosphate synthase
VIIPDLLLILIALLIDMIVGDPHWLPHPVVAIGQLIKMLDQLLHGSWLNQRMAGILLLLIVVVTSAGTTFLLLKICTFFSKIVGWIAAIIISSTCLAARSLHKESSSVAKALLAGDIQTARRYLSYIVGRDTDFLEEPEIWRAVVETVAENTSDGVIAPLFWLIIGGPVVAMAYKAVSTLDSMVGYKSERYLKFGWASARMDDLLNFIPARISAILLIIAAPLSGCSLNNAIRITVRDRLNHPSPNSGYPEAAVAGALGVRLGGFSCYGGTSSFKAYIGDSLVPIDEHAYSHVIRLMYVSTLLMATVCMIIAFCIRGIYVPFI